MSLQQRITALAQAVAADIKALTAGKLSTTGTAADASKLGGNLAAEFYRRANILGTVSQSSGVPTGAIIERGSNANGEYIRWADGTQICWTYKGATLSVGTTTGFTFSNAVAFAGVPHSYHTYSATGSTLEFSSGMEGHSNSGATVFVKYGGSSGARDVVVFFLSIGRWY